MVSDAAARAAPLPARAEGGRPLGGHIARSPMALWGGFVAVHVVVAFLALIAPGARLGDVSSVYLPWALQAEHGSVPGIGSPWVYPIAAVVPILVPLVAGAQHYVALWLVLVFVADALAFAVLVGSRRERGALAAWWWLGFTLLLGPVGLARLDTLCVPAVIVGLLWLSVRPRAAALLLTLATWVKVWPAAALAAIVVASRRRRAVAGIALAASVVIVVAALLLGAGVNVLSFVTAQTSRGVQVESPVGTIWMWQAALHLGGSFVYYDRPLNTFQVTGAGIGTAIEWMNPLLACAVAAVLLAGIRRVRLGSSRTGALTGVLAPLALALLTALIAFNKVGSPQYMLWLVPPIVLGLVLSPRMFRTPALLVAAMAGLTQVFYPYLYLDLLALNPVLVGVLTVRNVLLFVVLGWASAQLWRAGASPSQEPCQQSKE